MDEAADRGVSVDYLLPDLEHMRVSAHTRVLDQPMPKHRVLAYVPWLTHTRLHGIYRPTCGSPSASLHSCKATHLSWLILLEATNAETAAQGHHSTGRSNIVRLYGRTDVHIALRVQQLTSQSVRKGGRPEQSVARGSQAPVAPTMATGVGALLSIAAPLTLQSLATEQQVKGDTRRTQSLQLMIRSPPQHSKWLNHRSKKHWCICTTRQSVWCISHSVRMPKRRSIDLFSMRAGGTKLRVARV